MLVSRVVAALRRFAWRGAAAPRNVLLTPSGARFLGDGLPGGNPGDERAADLAVALAACAQLLAPERGRRIRIVLSDLWVRYCLIQTDAAASLADDELLALARGQLSRQHPDTAGWPLRVALQGDALLAAACRPDVVEALQALADKSGVRLAGIAPLFSHLLDGAAPAPGWLLLEEPGLLLGALVRAGGGIALHSARLDDDAGATALRLLDRQAALLGAAAGEVRLFSGSARPLALPPPWRIGSLTRF